jgi:hypothetical protein
MNSESKSKYLNLSIVFILAILFSLSINFYKNKASNKTEKEVKISESKDINQIHKSEFTKIHEVYAGEKDYFIEVSKDKDIFKIESANELCRYEIELPKALPLNNNDKTQRFVDNLNRNLNAIFISSKQQMDNCEMDFIKNEGNLLADSENNIERAIQTAKQNRQYYTYVYHLKIGYYNSEILSILSEGLIIPIREDVINAAHPEKFTKVYNIKPRGGFYKLDELFSPQDLDVLKSQALTVSKFDQTDGYSDQIASALSGPENIFFREDQNFEIVNIFDNFVVHGYHIKIPFWSVLNTNPNPLGRSSI